MKKTLKVHKIVWETRVEGPGVRTCVWTQGCKIKCPGCFNTQAQDINGGEEWDVHELAEKIAENITTRGVTIAGGEPSLQAEAVWALLRHLRELCPEKNTLLYTGLTVTEINNSKKRRKTAPIYGMVESADVTISGPFIKAKSPDPRRWIGSTNQLPLFRCDKMARVLDPWPTGEHKAEVRIGANEINVLGESVAIHKTYDGERECDK